MLALASTVLFAACAGTRAGEVGRLPTGDQLVTLVVTENRKLVERECANALSIGRVYGCQTTRMVRLPDGRPARAVRIVRYTDKIPSEMAFEIEVHEMCHVVAALQPIPDPCHVGNNGFMRSATR